MTWFFRLLGCHSLTHDKTTQLTITPEFKPLTLHPNISMHILLTFLQTFPKRLTRRICLIIKSCFSWWSSPLFSWLSCLIQRWYHNEKLDAIHSWGLKGLLCIIWVKDYLENPEHTVAPCCHSSTIQWQLLLLWPQWRTHETHPFNKKTNKRCLVLEHKLFNKLSYACILIGSHLWSIGGHTYRWHHH